VQNAEYLLPRIPQVLEVAPHRLSHTASMLRIFKQLSIDGPPLVTVDSQ
jgi:hypothetical protein